MLCLFRLFIEHRTHSDRSVLTDLNELVCNLFSLNISHNWTRMLTVVFDFSILRVLNARSVKIFFGYIFKLETYLCLGRIKGQLTAYQVLLTNLWNLLTALLTVVFQSCSRLRTYQRFCHDYLKRNQLVWFYRGKGANAWITDKSNRQASVVVPVRTDSTLSLLARAKTS